MSGNMWHNVLILWLSVYSIEFVYFQEVEHVQRDHLSSNRQGKHWSCHDGVSGHGHHPGTCRDKIMVFCFKSKCIFSETFISKRKKI